VKARLKDGWLVVGPYEANDMERAYIQVGDNFASAAFLDWDGAERVAKIRPPKRPGRHMVSLNGRQLNHVTIQ